MMLTAIVGAVFALLGVVLGGGVRAWESRKGREAEASALLSALVAEVEAVTRLANHRGFIPAMLETQAAAQIQIQGGQGQLEGTFLQIRLKYDYFAVFNASVSKLGILHPYYADRIVRFYTYAKACVENYDPDSPFQDGVSALAVNEIITNDLMLLHTMMMLGNHIASFRNVDPPKGVVNPFPNDQRVFEEPELPPSLPREANLPAGSTSRPISGHNGQTFDAP